jgi:competence protein ComEA
VEALTPAERRGALVVVLLLAIGASRDLWRAARPVPGPDAVPILTTAAASPVDSTHARGLADAEPVARPPRILDLNTASAGELDALPGIGPVLAARIIAHRQRHGPFRRREELLAVRGIGPRLLARLGPRVRVREGGESVGSDSLGPHP